MKINWKKFFIINFLLLIVVFIVAELCSLYLYRMRFADLIKAQANLCDNPAECIKEDTPRYIFPRKFDYKVIEEIVKPGVYSSDKKSSKRPIITIGCSYTYGTLLDRDQTFAYKLHELTGRTSYNRGVFATGTQVVYRQLIDKNFKKEVPDAEYVIYTFIYDHIRRNVRDLDIEYGHNIELNYEIKNGELVEKKRPFWFMYWSFLVKTYLEYLTNNRFINEVSNENPVLFKLLEKSVEQTHKLYPDSKFVFLEFPELDNCGDPSYSLNADFVKKITDMGIIYVNAEDLVGHDFCAKKYFARDEYHPSEEVWDEFVPLLVKKLNL